MYFRTLTLVLALCVALPAAAQITTVQLAHEVRLASVRLPASESGMLSFKACAECATTSARVTGETRWLINEQPVSLREFRSAIESRADRNTDYVTVRHHLEKDLITLVAMTVRRNN